MRVTHLKHIATNSPWGKHKKNYALMLASVPRYSAIARDWLRHAQNIQWTFRVKMVKVQ